MFNLFEHGKVSGLHSTIVLNNNEWTVYESLLTELSHVISCKLILKLDNFTPLKNFTILLFTYIPAAA